MLAATIQPNSVTLAADTTGDFVQSITGTSNEVTVSVTSGENSTPQIGLPNDVTIGQDLIVTRNISVGGVSTFTGAADFNGSLDVDGHTELDDLNVSGVSTFVGVGTFSNDLYVSDNLHVSGFVTATRLYSSVFGEFTGSIDAAKIVGASLSITPQTLNYLGADTSFEASGYTATIGDSRVLSVFQGAGVNTTDAAALNSSSTVGTNVSRTEERPVSL